MRRKKKGSSLVLVVFISALIIATATMMLTVVSSDFKSRVNRSKRIKSLYEADSGQNYVKNIIQKESDLAIIYANSKIYNKYCRDTGLVTDLNIEDDNYKRVNKFFKQKFIEGLVACVRNDSTDARYNNVPGYSNPDNTFQLLKYSIENIEYRCFNDERNPGESDDAYATRMKQSKLALDSTIDNDFTVVKEINYTNETDRFLEIEVKDLDFIIDTENDIFKIVVTVRSTFSDKAKGKSSIENKKTIELKYTINAPDYEPGFTGESTVLHVGQRGFDTAITADGNMIINSGEVEINGGAWIKGLDSTIVDSESKYKNGVLLKDKAKLYIDKLYTNGTLNLYNESALQGPKDKSNSEERKDKITASDEVYCLNVLLGGNSSEISEMTKNELYCNKLVTNNDLAINSSQSKVLATDYYGINDKHTDNTLKADKSQPLKEASSLIMNNLDENNVCIQNAYIAGVAYINLKDTKYQTGESVAVKGNYKAYTDVLPEYKDIKLEDYNGKKLIEGTLEEKAKYFNDYYSDKKSKDGGIVIENIFSCGAFPKDSVKKRNSSIDSILSKVSDEQNEYVDKVLCTFNKPTSNDEIRKIYNDYKVVRQVSGSDDTNSLIKFNKCNHLSYKADDKENVLKDKFYKYIYNPDKNNTIVITADGIKIRDEKGKYLKGDEEDICIKPEKGELKSVIITKGDVVFEGDENITLYGAIIAAGNVEFKGKNVKIYCNDEKDSKKQVLLTIAETEITNNKVYNVFQEPIEFKNQSAAFKVNLSTDYDRAYDSGTYLKEGLWKLVKKDGK